MSRRADEVLRRLRNDIVIGTYPPGSRLREAALCEAYGVSRVPVREALKQLEVEGFATSRAYAGMTVTHLRRDEAVDLFTVRQAIEQITVKRSAERFRRTPSDAEVVAFAGRLDELLSAGCGALDATDRSGLPPLNTEFHLSLAEFSQNPSLLSLLRQVSAKIEWLYAMDVHVRGEHSWAEHEAIAEAVRAGEPGRAGRLMRQHVRNSLDGYLARHVARRA